MINNWNIRRKLNTVLTLCGLVFIAILTPIISYLSFAQYQQSAQDQQVRLVSVLSTSAAIATFVSNEEIAEEVLHGLMQDDEILAVQIVGSNGFVKQLQSENNSTPMADNMMRYPLYSPVNGEDVIGEIHVWANDALIAARADHMVHQNVVALIVLTFLIAIVSMLAVNYLVARPLRRLADQVILAKPGEKRAISAATIHKNDEIGLVTDSVNGFLSVTRMAIEQERDLRAQVETMNQHFSSVFANSHVGIMVVDLKGRLLHHNPVLFESIIKLTDAQHQALTNSDVFSLAFHDASHDIWRLIEDARQSNTTVECDMPLVAAWREPCWVHCILTVNRDDSTCEEIIECVLHDVTRRVQEANIAKQQAQQDPLTGLHNRRGCERYLQQWLSAPKDNGQLVAMLLDLDSFKPVNDQFGHGAGDLVLQAIATRLQNEVRANTDLVGRIGGDEFVVFLNLKNADREPVKQVAQKILLSVAEPILLDTGEHVAVGVSIGIAFASEYTSLDDLMQAADAAMYQVKLKGKNDFVFAN